MKPVKAIIVLAIIISSALRAGANNISIANVASGTNNTGLYLSFDLSWENSWRNSTNWDAAWVFFKFKDYDGTWHHLNLSGDNTSITAGYTISTTDSTGAMIYRSADGYGTVTLTGVQVGVMNLPGSFDIKSFAIEMVQIPQNVPFYVGDGSGAVFNMQTGTTGTPYLINTLAPAITFGTAAGNLNDNAMVTPLATGFPIGYANTNKPNFMMKHEITQGAYRDFLNCLTYRQQITRTTAAPNSAAGTAALGGFVRMKINIKTPGVASTTPAVYGCNLNGNGVYDEATDGEWIACNYIFGADVLAFLDWAALRPMTDYEFEKACRGPLLPKPLEYAWGDSSISRVSYTVTNQGANNEGVTYTPSSVFNGNATIGGLYNISLGTLRVGMHATSTSTRVTSGAGYYGVLDMTGNVDELSVNSTYIAGRSFTGINGDGELNANGDANENYWPGINGNTTTTTANTTYGGVTGTTGNAGWGLRGGTFSSTIGTNSQVCYRLFSAGSTSRTSWSGGRGVKNW